MIIQFCGLSGAGKTTLARLVREKLNYKGYAIEIIDGDEYRSTLCKDLGFTKNDRQENMRRLAFVAAQLSKHGVVSIICAINPYEEVRNEIRWTYHHVKTVYIDCPLPTLQRRDTKGLYKRALLPDNHPNKIKNLTGINDSFDIPSNPDLHLNTATENTDDCVQQIVALIEKTFSVQPKYELKRELASPWVRAI